jgi:hypothetical protein
MRKAVTIVACVLFTALLLQASLHKRFPDQSLEWIPLVFVAVALRVSTRLIGRRPRTTATEKSVAPIRLKA